MPSLVFPLGISVVAIASQTAWYNEKECKVRRRVCEQLLRMGQPQLAVHLIGLVFLSPTHFLVSFPKQYIWN